MPPICGRKKISFKSTARTDHNTQQLLIYYYTLTTLLYDILPCACGGCERGRVLVVCSPGLGHRGACLRASTMYPR